jgi:hypothetical protein
MVSSRFIRHGLVGATGTMLLFLLCATVHSQDLSPAFQVTPSDNDRYAASQAQNVKRHAWPANTPAARSMRVMTLSSSHDTSAAVAPAAAAPDSGGPRFPADLSYHGGAVVASMEQHAIYLRPNGGCNIATCWGNPERFLRDLGRSEFIHVVDQYTGTTANHRYTVAEERTNINYTPPSTPFTDADMLAIVHAVVVSRAEDNSSATGYDNEYHVFLPPGQDECFNSTFAVCYSPDNPSTFFFCAYHGSADFSDIGHVLYSVEPFQDVGGCSSRPGTPNGQLVDSTNTVLSHEVIETITDPDGTAWWNSLDNGLFGQEIGDECSFLIFIPSGNSVAVYFDPSNITLNGHNYAAQPEYNNAQHACTTAP